MKRRWVSALLVLTFLLGACSPSAPAPQADSPPSAPSPGETPAPETGGQAGVTREAVVSEIQNTVSARSTSMDEFAEAVNGMKLLPGGGLETGGDGKARLDITPEGTIIRIAPNSAFTMVSITDGDDGAKTTTQLLFGKIFILLRGGSLEVETPSGVASVRGSLLSVQYNRRLNRVRASCLEGNCTLQNQAGDEANMIQGQSAYIDEDGNLSDIRDIDRDEIEEWLNENPDLIDFLDELPDPNDFFDFDDDEWYYDEDDDTDE